MLLMRLAELSAPRGDFTCLSSKIQHKQGEIGYFSRNIEQSDRNSILPTQIPHVPFGMRRLNVLCSNPKD